jgi:glycerol-3-phosphate dehydrogenase subunit B
MKYDTIIIGGGLSGLICGIRLQKAGKKCAIVSAGQNAMHFSSGGFGLYSRNADGSLVEDPFEAIAKLPAEHPYSKIGLSKVREYDKEMTSFLSDCGIQVQGDDMHNSYMITPVGNIKACKMALSDVTLLSTPDEKIGNKALIVNLLGYLDFNTLFIADSLEQRGTQCRIEAISLTEIEQIRRNPSEMRSVNIARVMDREDIWKKFVLSVRALIKDEDVIILPAVFALKDMDVVEEIRKEIGTKVVFIGTMPPSVPGIRTQMQLKKAFESEGGTFLMGDQVISARIEEDKVISLTTENMGSCPVEADNFVLASGSFFSKGLTATPEKIFEPLFGLDVDYQDGRGNWYDPDFFKAQKYLGFGVKTDHDFRAVKDGKTFDNLFAIGSILGGVNSLQEGSGSGVAALTALYVADFISEGRN